MEIIRIPLERIRALRGDDGKTRELIEEKCKIKLDIGDDGEVTITGERGHLLRKGCREGHRPG
jgi:rRNA processing protein Krr1/Pno1